MLNPEQKIAKDRLISYLNSTTENRIILTGSGGTGKEQPITSKVQTPLGEVPFGSLQVGQEIFTQNGTATKVLAIYPQGIKPVYKITFRDGTYTRCGLEHLWKVDSSNTSRPSRILTTKQLLELNLQAKNGDNNYQIPLCQAVQYSNKEYEFSPYLIGALLGDGSLTLKTPVLTCGDVDTSIAFEAYKNLPVYFVIASRQKEGCVEYRFKDTLTKYGNRLTDKIKELGINVKSGDRFIPLSYLYGSVSQRIELLQGLMDTDGSCHKNRARFHTTSFKLAQDVVTLVQSLGGIATINTSDRTHHNKSTEYHLSIRVSFNPFKASVKKDNWKLSTKNPPSKYIVSIVPDGSEEQMCITVDSPDSLYLTDSFIVTHNTFTISQVMSDLDKLLKLSAVIDSTKVNQRPWYFSATTNKAKQAIQRCLPYQEVDTIHSLLGLRPYRGYLTKSNNFTSKLSPGSILVIDEASYIDAKLLSFIDELVPKSVKVIYVGDANQLTPVKSTTCPVFHQGYEELKLTTLVRQTNAPLIGELSSEFKEYIESNGQLDFPKVSLSNEISHMSSSDFNALIEKVFIQDNGLTLHNRVLAGTNAVVNKHNTHLFGLANGRTELVAGDTVVSNNYVKGIKTDEEVIILSKSPYLSSIANCSGTIFSIQSMTHSTDVYVPDSHKKASKAVTDILDAPESIDKVEALELYTAMADLRPMYASTIHKSQGSTFENVYIDLGSLSYVRDKIALARLLYVAISRASKHVYLTGDIS